MTSYHDTAISFARYQGTIDPQVVTVTLAGLDRALVRVTALSCSDTQNSTPDHQRELANVRDIEVQLDDTGKLLWRDYDSARFR